MASTPLVSLLIPTYNSALTVAEAIASCCQQTFQDIEILVYDEASQDNTREFLSAAAARDPRVRVMTSASNSGPVRAWRKLLHEARGRWSTFIWSDDLILPKYVETLLQALEQHPGDIIAGCGCYSDVTPESPAKPEDPPDPSRETGQRRLLHGFETVRMRGDAYALVILAAVFPVSQICSLFETETAKDVFDHCIQFDNPYGFDYSRRAYGNDVSFLSELALRSGELMEIGEPLVVCRASPGSMTVNARRDHRWQYWLQYVYAIRAAWTRCRHLSPRMDHLVRVVDERVKLCDLFYSLGRRQWPREPSLLKPLQAVWFLMREDRRMNNKVSPATIEKWLASRSR